MNVYNVTFFIIVVILFLFCYFRLNSKALKITFSFCPMLVLLACRGNNVGTDTYMYISLFDSLSSCEISYDNWAMVEPSFIFIVRMLHLITDNNQVLIIFYAVVTLLIIGYLFYKYSPNVDMGIVLFCSLFWLENFNTMRQCLSVPISYLAIFCLLNDHKFKFLLINFVAMLVHSSAILFFLLILIYPFSRRKIVSVMIVASLCCFLFIQFGLDILSIFLSEKYASYFLNINYSTGKQMGIGILKAIAFLCMVFYALILPKYYKNNDAQGKMVYCMSMLLFCSTIVTFLQYEMNIFSRLVYPMSFSILFLFPQIWKDFGYKRYFLYPIVIVFLIYYLNRFSVIANDLEYSFFT